ncbi:MAG: cell division protein FtsQ/DivIB, partial [Opitutales bacterium]
WRELAGPRRRRGNSPQARKRRREQWFKLLLVVLAVLLLAAGAAALFTLRGTGSGEETARITPPSKPIDRILFDTNGVLPDRWIREVIGLKPGTRMMDVDIGALKARVEAHGQVKSARVERVFPSALQVVVEERSPVLRLAIAGSDGKPRQRIVARDGTIYQGVGYPRAMLSNLPYLEPFRHADGGYRPLLGIERVADLIELARQEHADLFRNWRVVSLRHYSGDLEMPGQVIEVRTQLVPRIIFSASGDYARQLDRLRYILKYVEQRGSPSIKRIDLSLRGSAAVQFSSGRIGSF